MYSKVVIDPDRAKTERDWLALAALLWTQTLDGAFNAIYADPRVRQACRFGSESQAWDTLYKVLRYGVTVQFGARKLTIEEWEKDAKTSSGTIWKRLERGVPVGQALGFYKSSKPKKPRPSKVTKPTGTGEQRKCE